MIYLFITPLAIVFLDLRAIYSYTQLEIAYYELVGEGIDGTRERKKERVKRRETDLNHLGE
jgi:hypothetical protein